MRRHGRGRRGSVYQHSLRRLPMVLLRPLRLLGDEEERVLGLSLLKRIGRRSRLLLRLGLPAQLQEQACLAKAELVHAGGWHCCALAGPRDARAPAAPGPLLVRTRVLRLQRRRRLLLARDAAEDPRDEVLRLDQPPVGYGRDGFHDVVARLRLDALGCMDHSPERVLLVSQLCGDQLDDCVPARSRAGGALGGSGKCLRHVIRRRALLVSRRGGGALGGSAELVSALAPPWRRRSGLGAS
mmetsp:Transcript_11843/g.33751  ORF Transcript_11843/g.33751 Transcript_11843/m.33751 type:complete len:241 (-) Transcript_11843:263-985(-)